MRKYETLGNMARVNVTDSAEHQYSFFLLNYAVVKETSTTTKLRVVFDGSEKFYRSLDKWCANCRSALSKRFILIRFHKHRFVLFVDIEKIYRQIYMREDDRRFQCILWRYSPNKPISIYELNTVTYGIALAPFLATQILEDMCSLEFVDQSSHHPWLI